MTTSPAPISAADREKARVDLIGRLQRELRVSSASYPWSREDSYALLARVVELEAALAKHLQTLQAANDIVRADKSRAEAAEARATALLEALRPFANLISEQAALKDEVNLHVSHVLGPSRRSLSSITVGQVRAARAAINAGASNDRK